MKKHTPKTNPTPERLQTMALKSERSDHKWEAMPAELLERAKELSRKQGYVSVSYLQRNLPIGYWLLARWSICRTIARRGFLFCRCCGISFFNHT